MKLKADASKAEEIKFLEGIQKSVGEGSYLSTLFTDDFVGRVTRWINDDWTCDMAGVLQAHMDEGSDLRVEMEANRKRYAREITELEEQAKELSNHLGIANGTIGEQEETIEAINDYHSTVRMRQGEARDAWKEQLAQLRTQIEQLESTNEVYSQQVLKLKAFMFDLQNENTNLKQALERGEYYND